MKKILSLCLWVFVLVCAAAGQAAESSADGLWRTVDRIPAAKISQRHDIQPNKFKAFNVDTPLLRSRLGRAPKEFNVTPGVDGKTEITLPKPDGTFAQFNIEEVALMEPELAAKFPEIKTYRGRGVTDPMATLQLDVNDKTLHAQVLSPSGTYYVDPYYQHDGSVYMSYAKSDLTLGDRQFKCLVEGRDLNPRIAAAMAAASPASAGQTLRTYRLACATSMRYSQYHGGNVPVVADVLAALVTMNNRISGVYETELGIRLILVGNNDLIIASATNPTPYTDTPGDIGTNPPYIDSKIGEDNYDIGHVVTVGSGGVAGLGVVCLGFNILSGGSDKAAGTTGIDPPVGDGFWIDYVAHEMGHQFGGNHTFNGDGTNCGDVNQNPSTAYEPGSGSTIQAYAGICGAANNLQPHSDAYWHFISLEEMFAYSTAGDGGTCPVQTPTGNNPPSVSAGADYKIPARTPFALTAINGFDPDGDPLTYCWEEADLGPQKAGTAPDNGQSA
ncbi:MAG TPA: zinc-dependent metalloprotease family protein, partial [Chthoniobacterales bacterium]|nr:zinc-dependent metalloprotease family protein [Chthoniobacterales bacterium]